MKWLKKDQNKQKRNSWKKNNKGTQSETQRER